MGCVLDYVWVCTTRGQVQLADYICSFGCFQLEETPQSETGITAVSLSAVLPYTVHGGILGQRASVVRVDRHRADNRCGCGGRPSELGQSCRDVLQSVGMWCIHEVYCCL